MKRLWLTVGLILAASAAARATSTITLELTGPASILNDGVSSTTLEVREQHFEGGAGGLNALIGLSYRLEGYFSGYDPSAVPTPTVFRGSFEFDGTGPGAADTGNGNAAGPWDSGTPNENGYLGFTVAGDYLHNQGRYVVPAAGSIPGSPFTTRLVDTITISVDPGTAPGVYCIQFNDNDTIAPQWYNAGAQTIYFLGSSGVGYFGPPNNSVVCVTVFDDACTDDSECGTSGTGPCALQGYCVAGDCEYPPCDDCTCDDGDSCTHNECQGGSCLASPVRGACCLDDGASCANTTCAICRNTPGATFLGEGSRCPMQNVGLIREPGGEIFIHQVGPPQGCPDPLRGVRGAFPPGSALLDPWISPAAGVMCHSFDVSGSPPIPAGFFAAGSAAFSGSVCLEGQPLGLPEYGDADTLILRSADPFSRCDPVSPAESTVEISVAALSLIGTAPITVMVDGSPQQWNVEVDLSDVPAPTGSLTAVKTFCNGGAYTSVLHVQPRFTFTKADDPGMIRVLDTGLEGIAPVSLIATDPAPWVHNLHAYLGVPANRASAFHAGIQDMNPAGTGIDLNDDMTVDMGDFDVIHDAFGHAAGDAEFSPYADLDGDGIVTLVDYQNWLCGYRCAVSNPGSVPPEGPLGDFDQDFGPARQPPLSDRPPSPQPNRRTP